MRDKIGRFFSHLNEKVELVSREEDELNQEELQEREYIKSLNAGSSFEDKKRAVELLLEEIKLAGDIESNLAAAEKDEIQIEKILVESEKPVNQRLKQRFERSESKVENLVEIFFEELKILDQNAKNLASIIQSSANSELTEELSTSITELDNVKDRVEKLQSREEQMEMGRRKMMAGTAAVATGSTLQSIIEQTQPEEQHTKGKVAEDLKIEELGLEIKAEVIRTSHNSGYFLLKARNISGDRNDIEVEIDLGNWAASGATNILEGDTNRFRTKFNLAAGSTSSCGITLYEPSDNSEPGSDKISFVLHGNQWKKRLDLNIPGEIARDHEVNNSRSINGLNLRYSSKPVEPVDAKGNSYEAKIYAENVSGAEMEISASLNYPSGWYKTGMVGDFDASTSGIVVGALQNLNPGKAFEMETKLVKNSETASDIGLIAVTYFPKNCPEKASNYIVPIDLT